MAPIGRVVEINAVGRAKVKPLEGEVETWLAESESRGGGSLKIGSYVRYTPDESYPATREWEQLHPDEVKDLEVPKSEKGIHAVLQDEVTGETLVLYRGERPVSINNLKIDGITFIQNFYDAFKQGNILGYHFVYASERPEGRLHKVLGIPAEKVIRGKWKDQFHPRSVLGCFEGGAGRNYLESIIKHAVKKIPLKDNYFNPLIVPETFFIFIPASSNAALILSISSLFTDKISPTHIGEAFPHPRIPI